LYVYQRVKPRFFSGFYPNLWGVFLSQPTIPGGRTHPFSLAVADAIQAGTTNAPEQWKDHGRIMVEVQKIVEFYELKLASATVI
jgi:hypothetical protein